MLWLLLLAANEVGVRDVRVSAPAIEHDSAVSTPTPRLIEARYNLRANTEDASDFRLEELDRIAVPARRGRPLAVTAIDDERQRLVIGVKPGTGKNKLGIAYRLRFGR